MNNLIAAPILCDAGCEVKFTKTDVTVTKIKKILQGWRDPKNNLWRIPLIQKEIPRKKEKIQVITTSCKTTTMKNSTTTIYRVGKGMLCKILSKKNHQHQTMQYPTAYWQTAYMTVK